MSRLRRPALLAALVLTVAGAAAVPLAAAASTTRSHRAGHRVCARVIARRRLPATVIVKRTARGPVLFRQTIRVRTVDVLTRRADHGHCTVARH